jgi:threonylcarbamoyladenosine tRNA methylthiotransferase MtaB
VIHRARGKSISLDEDAVLNQVRTFVASGSAEIVVCGVDLGSYEYSSSEREVDALGLVSLLKKISRLPGEFRIRLSSIDPAHLNDSLLDLMGSDERFCPYLHVSVQSGSTLILKRMKRRYDRQWLLERLFAARERLPGLVLGADIMAGFPTESEADFAQSLSVIKDAEIIYPHVFPFSARPGTPAARIPRQVSIPERRRRAAEMRRVGQTVRNQALEGMVGRRGQLLIERPVVSDKPGAYHGRLENYMPVQVRRLKGGSGDIVPIQVDSVESDVLIAHMLGSE